MIRKVASKEISNKTYSIPRALETGAIQFRDVCTYGKIGLRREG